MRLLPRLSHILQAFLRLSLSFGLWPWVSSWAIILTWVMDGIGSILLLLLLACLIRFLEWWEFLDWELLDFLDLWGAWRVCLRWSCWLKLCLVRSFSLEVCLDLLLSFLLSLLFWESLCGLVRFILDAIFRSGLIWMEVGLLLMVMIFCVLVMISVVLGIFVEIGMML